MNERRKGCRVVLVAIALLATACNGCSRDDPRDLSYRAQSEFEAGRPAEAEAALVKLEGIRKLTVEERLLRSRLASDRGRIDLAMDVLENPRPPTKGRDAALIASRRGELELERRRFRAAEAELKRALILNPHDLDARRHLIWLYMQQGRSAEIAAESRAMARSSSLEFLDLVVWTLARHEPVDQADVARVLGEAVENDPGDRASRLALAESLRRLGRLDEADHALDALAEGDPAARAERARVALDRGESSRAEALIASDLEGDDRALVCELRGRLALGRGDVAAAVQHFRAAIAAAPDDRDARFGLSQALKLSGEAAAARPHAELARGQDRLEWLVRNARSPNRRNDPAILHEIAKQCLVLGRRDLARGWIQQALRLAPDDAGLRSALSELDSAAVIPGRCSGLICRAHSGHVFRAPRRASHGVLNADLPSGRAIGAS
jgi:tetratricopeptide (TPR) repeat protein